MKTPEFQEATEGGSLCRLVIRNRKVILAALYLAAEWEDTLTEAYKNMKDDPEYQRSKRAARRYRRLRERLIQDNAEHSGTPPSET